MPRVAGRDTLAPSPVRRTLTLSGRMASNASQPVRCSMKLGADAMSLAEMAAQERDHLLYLVAVLCGAGEDVIVPTPFVIHGLYRLASGS